MEKIIGLRNYFTKTELMLWCLSVGTIISAFLIFEGESNFILAASLIGVTSLILSAKGNPMGQLISVTTSFMAVYLSYRRSAYYAVAYAFNDLILIILWVLAAMSDATYTSMAVCFVVFFVNDIYGFINWSRMHKRQNA